MTNIYKVRSESDRFQSFGTVPGPVIGDLGPMIDGTPATEWFAPRLEDISLEQGLAVADYSSFQSIPLFSRRAQEALTPQIDSLGEWLPVEAEAEGLSVFNVTTVIDAIDQERSEIEWNDAGKVIFLRNLVSKIDPSELPMVFKVPQWMRGPMMVTDEFRDLVLANGLTGFRFLPLTKSR